VLPGEVRSGAVNCALGVLPVRQPEADGVVRVMIRPEQIRVEAPSGAGVSARLLAMSFFGPDSLLRLELAVNPDAVVIARVLGESGFAVGDAVNVRVDGPVATFRDSPSTLAM
jgi:iron(III) transport system ATP-binding protein